MLQLSQKVSWIHSCGSGSFHGVTKKLESLSRTQARQTSSYDTRLELIEQSSARKCSPRPGRNHVTGFVSYHRSWRKTLKDGSGGSSSSRRESIRADHDHVEGFGIRRRSTKDADIGWIETNITNRLPNLGLLCRRQRGGVSDSTATYLSQPTRR
jgi:hypothetical protein